MKTMAFKILGNVHIVMAGEQSPSDADWNEYTTAVNAELKRGVDIGAIRTLVFTDGGGPNAAQRKRVNDDLNGRSTPVAFVSSSTMMRGIVTALQWFNPDVRTFNPEQVVDAMNFLKIPDTQHELVWNESQKLRESLKNINIKSIRPGTKLPRGKW